MTVQSQISITQIHPSSLQEPSSTCKTKFNRKGLSRQAFWELNFSLDSKIQEDITSYYQALHPSEKAFFNYLIAIKARCRHVYPTLAHISKKIRFSERQIQRNTNKFIADGLLIKNYRHMTSNEYRLNPFLLNPRIHNIIRSISNGVKFLSLALLFSFTRFEKNELVSCSEPGCRSKTLLNEYIYKKYSSNSSTTRYIARAHKHPRPATQAEQLESVMINTQATQKRIDPFDGALARLGKLLNMTDAGRIDFARYPEKTLLHAETLLVSHGRNLNDPYSWVHAVCIRHCKENNLYIDHAFSRDFARNLSIDLESEPKVNCGSKSNGEERIHPGQYDKTSGHVNVNLDPNMGESRAKYSQDHDINKEGNDEGEYSHRYNPSHIRERTRAPKGYTRAYKPSTPYQKAMTQRESTQGEYYNATTGSYSNSHPESQVSSRVRPKSDKPPATREEALAIVARWTEDIEKQGLLAGEKGNGGAAGNLRGLAEALKGLAQRAS